LLCTEDDNSCYRNVCKMSVVSFALAVVFIIRLFSTSAFRVPTMRSIIDKQLKHIPSHYSFVMQEFM